MRNATHHITGILIAALVMVSCSNPFAPGLAEEALTHDPLGDQTTIGGFFTRFRNAYQLRDTTIYGPLIQSDFTFAYHDFDSNVDVSWGRDVEMNSTYNLFTQSEDIQLQWNNIITQVQDSMSTKAQVVRRFDLAIVLKNSDVLHTDGAANFLLSRSDSTKPWRLIRWRDESNF